MRDILRDAVKEERGPRLGLGSRIAARFAKVGLEPHEDIPELRGHPAIPIDFDK